MADTNCCFPANGDAGPTIKVGRSALDLHVLNPKLEALLLKREELDGSLRVRRQLLATLCPLKKNSSDSSWRQNLRHPTSRFTNICRRCSQTNAQPYSTASSKCTAECSLVERQESWLSPSKTAILKPRQPGCVSVSRFRVFLEVCQRTHRFAKLENSKQGQPIKCEEDTL